MPLLALLGLLLVLAIVLGPSLWVRATLALYAAHRSDIPGTGAELARHLLDRFGLETVAVEVVPEGDHYDPDARAVRLSPIAYEGCSVVAVAVAAHEVGHAIQHRDGYGPLRTRTRLIKTTVWVQRLGAGICLRLTSHRRLSPIAGGDAGLLRRRRNLDGGYCAG